MYDMHYDLLTILYTYLTKNNKNYSENKLKEILDNIYENNNVKGGVINLYFTPVEEMISELGISEEECINIKKMMSESLEYLKLKQEEGLIPKNLNYIVGIEGCDYITPSDLEYFYNQFHLRSIIPVWNHENQYGSGNRTEKGLTKLGEELINKAIELGIIIDVSHANEKTFYDILDVYSKNKNLNKVLMASHSNVRNLCDKQRNLFDNQLKRLNEENGYIGIFSNCSFVFENFKDKPYEYRIQKYIEHIDYLINVIGFNKEHIFLSTDDMNFDPDEIYHHKEAFKNSDISLLREQLINKYGFELTDNIMIHNAEKLIEKIK